MIDKEHDDKFPEPPKRNGLLRVCLIAVGAALAVGIVISLFIGGEPDPNEMARAYIEGNIDKLGRMSRASS